MAYITHRPAGWCAQVRRKGAPSISRTFDLKADAEAWAREIERELQRGNVSVLRQEAQRMTVAEAIDLYSAQRLPDLKSAPSVRVHLTRAKARFGSLFLANVRSADIAAWSHDLARLGLGPQSVLHNLNALGAVFTFAEKDLSIDLPAGNPVHKIRKPRMPKARDRRLRPGEFDALQSERPDLLAFVILAVETSMRRGEICGLEWSRVDLRRRTAHLVDTKNGESRTVALSSVAVAALQSLPRRIDGKVFGWATPDGFSLAFRRHRLAARKAHVLGRLREALAADGLSVDAIEAEIRAVVYKHRKPAPRTAALLAGIEQNDKFLTDLRFHDLRHEAASRLFEKGLGIMEVASMTGHKSLSMLKRYTHIEAEKLAQKLG
ncbi:MULTISPECIES: site-specific integrase [unclassified Thiomonas]|jgi:integrase|uniref:site-specific integrase n=1 Tax=unclassified Thiomonas TaxID=2625466 RepID=UPI000BD3F0B8|nr:MULTISPECIES: site-specific integrase [unclassified Thiomonas]OZB72184.1 MAG: integrase [Thiomonas sp. 13-64-67]